jgi:hypothetical protein
MGTNIYHVCTSQGWHLNQLRTSLSWRHPSNGDRLLLQRNPSTYPRQQQGSSQQPFAQLHHTRTPGTHLVDPPQHLLGNRVVHSVVPILDVLVGQLPDRGQFVAVRTLRPTLALPPCKETADRSAITLQDHTRSSAHVFFPDFPSQSSL